MLEKFAAKELVEFERFSRDNELWDQMHQCFAENSEVEITWYSGNGHGFVESSRNNQIKAPHKLNNTIVWLVEDRAFAITMGSIQVRKVINGKDYDLESDVRFFYTTEKFDGEWKIVSMNCVYEKDSLLPAWPSDLICECNMDRPSYNNLATLLGSEGYNINLKLPGDDKPEQVNDLLQKTLKWLYDDKNGV